mgnify:CR=1 FL=1
MPGVFTVVRMGKIIKDGYPELEENDVEAVRRRAVAALNITQGATAAILGGADDDKEPSANTALIDGVRKFALSVRDLDIDLIDAINPFGEAYSILAKSMDEDSLKQVASVSAAKRNTNTPDEAVTCLVYTSDDADT